MRDETKTSYTRRDFLAAAGVAPFVITSVTFAGAPINITSPNRAMRFSIQPDLHYSVSLRNKLVIENAKLGIVIDGVDIGRNATVGNVTKYRTNDQYEWRGVHAKAVNRCNGAKVAIRHPQTKTDYTIEIRVFDDGVAFRYLLPDVGKRAFPKKLRRLSFPQAAPHGFMIFTAITKAHTSKKRSPTLKTANGPRRL